MTGEARFEFRNLGSLRSSAAKGEAPTDPPRSHPRSSALLFLPWFSPTPGLSRWPCVDTSAHVSVFHPTSHNSHSLANPGALEPWGVSPGTLPLPTGQVEGETCVAPGAGLEPFGQGLAGLGFWSSV